jgi:hypothetical protein
MYYIYLTGVQPTAGTLSMWVKPPASNIDMSIRCIIGTYDNNSSAYITFTTNGIATKTTIFIGNGTTGINLGASTNDWYHIYAVWSTAGTLGSGNKYARTWINGTINAEKSNNALTAPNADMEFRVEQYSTGSILVDNLKIWNTAIDDPTAEYNSGTGRESYG